MITLLASLLPIQVLIWLLGNHSPLTSAYEIHGKTIIAFRFGTSLLLKIIHIFEKRMLKEIILK